MKVKGVGIAELTGLSVTRALETVKNWKLQGRESQIGKRPVDEVRNRLEFLVGVGLGYLSLERSAATLIGRGSAAHSAGDADRLEAARRFVRPRRTVDRPAFAR